MTRVSEEPHRWSTATVHTDMWVNPDDDPRNSGGVSPDGELATLQDYLRDYREVERDWCNWIKPGDPLPKLYGEDDADFDGAVAEQSVVDVAYADLAHEQAATDAVLAKHRNLGERLGQDGIALRELLIHRIEEYARHCGHADLLRERVDGRVGQ